MDTLADMFTRSTQRLIHDSYYVAHVFKKTEKVCNAVYFITSHIPNTSVGQTAHQSDIVREVESSALALLGQVHSTLSRTRDELPVIAPSLSMNILDLQAKLGLLASTGRMPREHLAIFHEELDTLERAIYFHEPDRSGTTLANSAPERLTQKRAQAHMPARQRNSAPQLPQATPITQTKKDTGARSLLIKDVLMKQPRASIKDIARNFPDVSEKTIQRELNSLIEQGHVRKEGLKRWSRYILADA